MTMEPWEAEQEEGLSRMYDDVVKDFTAERLSSYYLAHPDLAKRAHAALIYSESLRLSHPAAALVFAVTSIELSVKTVLLQPIVSGLVHTEELAAFITDLATQKTRGIEPFRGILDEILRVFCGFDFKNFVRSGSRAKLLDEIKDMEARRNKVVHAGEMGDDATADLAISIATTLLHEIFPMLLERLDLQIDDAVKTVSKRHHPWRSGADLDF